MNQQVKNLIEQVGTDTSGKWLNVDNAEELVKLVVVECLDINRTELNFASFANLHDLYSKHFGVEL